MALSTSRTLVTKTGISTTQVFDMGGINISGGDFNLGSAIKLGNASGIITCTTFSGSGASLTNLPAGNLTGTVADARISALTASKLSGALPAISGANLTSLNASNIGSGTVPTARLGSGTANNTTFLRGDSTFQTVNTDLVSDTSPQLGGNLDTNSHNIYLDDDHKVIFGNDQSADLHIFHESSSGTGNIYNATGELRIRSNDLRLKNLGNSETYLKATNNGAVELYHDNSKRFETTSTGASVTGNLVVSDDITLTGANYGASWDKSNDHLIFNDGAKAVFGTGEDLVIRHASSQNRIQTQNNITLYLKANVSGTLENMAKFVPNGAAELYHDNSLKFETTSTGTRTTGAMHINDGAADSNRISVGNGGDLKIFHTNPNTYIQDSSSALVINAARLDINNAADNEQMARFTQDGAVELYHDNTKTAWTHGSGFNIKGGNTSDQTELIISGNEGRNAEILLAADDGDDNADYWKIISSNDNSFYLQNYTAGSYETNIKATGNGGVDLYHDNSARLYTTSGGVRVYNSGVSTLQIDTGDSRGQAWNILSTNGAQNNTGTLSFRDESGSAYLEFGANGGSPELSARLGGANDLFNIDNNGRVKTPYQPAFYATANSGGTVSMTSTHTLTNWRVSTSGKTYNIGSHFNTSNGRFTAPVAGTYIFTASVLLAGYDQANSIHMMWRKNGTTMQYWYNTRTSDIDRSGYGGYLAQGSTTTFSLSTNDYIDIACNFGGSLSLWCGDNNWGHFSGMLLG